MAKKNDDPELDLAVPKDMHAAMNMVKRSIHPREPVAVRSIHCPVCGGPRRVDLDLLYISQRSSEKPQFARLTCRDCHTEAHALLYDGPSGEDVVIVWPTAAGLRTPSTPSAVAYYIDQASRSESAGARSAAIAMYRAALEQLLFEQGYTKGMLTAKITTLEADITTGTAKKWARDLAPEFLKVIRDLGNGAIHPNGGDIQKQTALDAELLQHVRTTMQELLDVVYEEPKRRDARLAKLQEAASVVK